MLMMRPERALSMGWRTAWVSRNAPVRLVRSTSSKSASFMRRTSPSLVMPALLTRISSLPKCARTAFAADLMESSEATSRAKVAAVPPAASISALTSTSFDSLRAARAICAPSAASWRAMARPMPCEAPVMRAVFPVRLGMMLLTAYRRRLYESVSGCCQNSVSLPDGGKGKYSGWTYGEERDGSLCDPRGGPGGAGVCNGEVLALGAEFEGESEGDLFAEGGGVSQHVLFPVWASLHR